MRILPFALLGLAALASAQDEMDKSPARAGEGEKMVSTALAKAASAIRSGRAVAITIDNRSTVYAPRIVRGMVYVPIRLFQETGQEVTWSPRDLRATLRAQNGTQKASVVFDAKYARRTNEPPPGMRPVYEKGRVWVPLAAGLAPFGHMVEWVPASNRLNVRTNRTP